MNLNCSALLKNYKNIIKYVINYIILYNKYIINYVINRIKYIINYIIIIDYVIFNLSIFYL